MEQRNLILIGIAGVIVFLMLILLLALGVVGFLILQAPAADAGDVSASGAVAPAGAAADPADTQTPAATQTPPANDTTDLYTCSDPLGGEADVECVGDKVMKCTDNVWVQQEICHSENACKNGACTTKTCASPDAYEGEFICETSDSSKTEKRTLYQCTSTESGQVAKNWAVKETCTTVSSCDATAGKCT